MAVSCIRRATWVIAWSRSVNSHVYMREVDVAFSEDGVLYIGSKFTGNVDREIDGTNRLVMPGLVNIHTHPSVQAIFRGLTEEFGNPRLFYSGRHELKQSLLPDETAMRAAARFTLAELLVGGVTTVVDLSHPYPGWLEILAESGMRVCVAPMYRSARWFTDTGQATKYEWDEEKGWEDFEEAKELMDQADHHPSGRLFSMVAPAQVDTCSEALLRASQSYAEQTNRPLHVHAAQSYAEFQEMTRRHDMTPIEWLHSIGFLSERTVVGHAVFTDQHPWLHWPTRRDLQLMRITGTSVAHCPTVFARDGTILHSLGRYHDSGVNLAIGTDTHPHNLLEELRWAEILARVADGPTHRLGTKKVFDFATIGGSRALLRDDLGRLAPGYPADIVIINLGEPTMLPLYDPLRSLIYGSADRAVQDVFIAGNQVVSNGNVLTLKRDLACKDLQDGQDRAIATIPKYHDLKRSIDQIMPRTLHLVDEL